MTLQEELILRIQGNKEYIEKTKLRLDAETSESDIYCQTFHGPVFVKRGEKMLRFNIEMAEFRIAEDSAALSLLAGT